jgi:cytochrome c553
MTMRRLWFSLGLALTVGLAGACSKNNEPPPPSSGSPNAKPESGPHGGAGPVASQKTPAERAQAMYSTVCVMCHGPGGKGDGGAAASLNPKPRNYTDSAWQASVTDDQIKQIILQGGQGVGKSPMMPAQPQLAKDPELLNELVKIIRGFNGK